jgi:purine-binding chemotaxis protein CheW
MMAANSNTSAFDEKGDSGEEEYVTVAVADQMFGLAIDQVHDVFIASSLTAVPLAPREIVGLLNLRGRVVTAICLRRRLGLPDRAESMGEMAVGLEHQGESYGLLVDEVGEVMRLSPESREPNPAHMDERWLKLSRGDHRLDRKLLIILDVDAVLSFDVEAHAA